MKISTILRRIVPALVIGLTAGGVGVVVNQAPASADSTTVWLWQDTNFSGYAVGHYTWDRDFSGQTYSGGGAPALNDSVSSIWNTSSYTMCFYTDSDFRGSVLRLAPGEQRLWVGDAYNDKISSMQPCG